MAICFSIITPVLNRAAFIGAALDSVETQRAGDVEHIVVDGGSTDGTLELVYGREGIRCVSEPDRGLYDAINKGVARARGELIGLLNSDDAYEPWALNAVREAFTRSPTAEMVAGGAAIYAHAAPDAPPVAVIDDFGTKMLRPQSIATGVPIINARFFRRSLMDWVGPFDQRFPVVADRDFLIRCIAGEARVVSISERVYRYTSPPGSLSVFPYRRSLQIERDLAAASLRLRECHGGRLGALYRSWHAWCVGHRAGALLLDRSPRAALEVCVRGFAEAPLWAVRFIPLLTDHWIRSRRRRRGTAALDPQTISARR
jgi:glycosyltransferase involved in cell wall biosynthesis